MLVLSPSIIGDNISLEWPLFNHKLWQEKCEQHDFQWIEEKELFISRYLIPKAYNFTYS